jgi:hypothetical protein
VPVVTIRGFKSFLFIFGGLPFCALQLDYMVMFVVRFFSGLGLLALCLMSAFS